MSYVAAAAGLKTVLIGLRTAGGLRAVIKGEPGTAHALPLAFMEADSGTRSIAGQLTINTYRTRVSVLVAFQDNVLAEDALEPWVNDLSAAIDADATLGGAVNLAQVVDWVADHYDIGEVKTRRLFFIVQMMEKSAYRGGN